MKVVSWNLGYWQHHPFHDEAWTYLRDCIQPDIALLQEVSLPALTSNESVIFSEVRKPWGTAIYARDAQLEGITTRSYPTRVAAAKVKMRIIETELHVASIHAPVINGRVFPHLSTIFDEVESILVGHEGIIGGDLNSARLAEKVWPGYGHGPFFQRLESSTFTDCHRRFHLEEVQTFFRPNSRHPFQDDHLFATSALSERLRSCDVLSNETTRRVSDHIPLVATFDL